MLGVDAEYRDGERSPSAQHQGKEKSRSTVLLILKKRLQRLNLDDTFVLQVSQAPGGVILKVQ